jgi:hypothetical protein
LGRGAGGFPAKKSEPEHAAENKKLGCFMKTGLVDGVKDLGPLVGNAGAVQFEAKSFQGGICGKR